MRYPSSRASRSKVLTQRVRNLNYKGVGGSALMDRDTGLSAGDEISAYFADVRQYVGDGRGT